MPITDHAFHAHIYFDAQERAAAETFAKAARERFAAEVGRFHDKPVGPHPRGSCQLLLSAEAFGPFAAWAATARNGLTVFAHADTGDDPVDHTEHVVWFGASEPLNLQIFE